MLIAAGHEVVLHGRSVERARQALAAAPGRGYLPRRPVVGAAFRWNASSAYADSKLHDVLLAFAVARRWPAVSSNAVDPGWVATKMGGRGAPGTLEEGGKTQVWLAVATDAFFSGRYFYRMHEAQAHPSAGDVALQEKLLATCARLSGINFPGLRV